MAVPLTSVRPPVPGPNATMDFLSDTESGRPSRPVAPLVDVLNSACEGSLFLFDCLSNFAGLDLDPALSVLFAGTLILFLPMQRDSASCIRTAGLADCFWCKFGLTPLTWVAGAAASRRRAAPRQAPPAGASAARGVAGSARAERARPSTSCPPL